MLIFTGTMFVNVILFHITGNVFGDCDTAPSITGAFHNGSVTGPYSEGVVLRYLCSQAYDRILGGSNYYQCYSGIWTGGNLTCTLGCCTAIDSPSNSYIVGQAGYCVGETITFSCQEGYEINGVGSIMCMADRSWSPNPPTCSKVRCPEFSTPDAEIFQDFSGFRNEFGSKNKITCRDGTFLQGPQYITCLANKTWSGSPSCTIPNCGNPPASYEPCTEVYYTDGNTKIGSQVEVFCLENAIPLGADPLLICSVNGNWSQEYHCLCGCIVDKNSAVYTGNRSVKHNSKINWSCQDGINSVSTCWNGTFKPSINCTKVATTTASTTIPLINSTELTTTTSSTAMKTIVKGSNRVADIKVDAEYSPNTVRNSSDSTSLCHGILTNMLIFCGSLLSLLWKKIS